MQDWFLYVWTVLLLQQEKVERVALLNDAHRKHFYIASITSGQKKAVRNFKLEPNCQEYVNFAPQESDENNEYSYRIKARIWNV